MDQSPFCVQVYIKHELLHFDFVNGHVFLDQKILNQ
jgi:hypothetical protein